MSSLATNIPEIQLENVEMRYRTEAAEVLALHQVSLDIAKGSSSPARTFRMWQNDAA